MATKDTAYLIGRLRKENASRNTTASEKKTAEMFIDLAEGLFERLDDLFFELQQIRLRG